MKYKVGDKVVLIKGSDWDIEVITAFDKLPNRVATIKEFYGSGIYDYYMKEIGYGWKDSDIKSLADEKCMIFEPVDNRFELMDNEQKTFRDFFGRDIKVGDKVLHLWAVVSHHGISGGHSAIKHKVATVINFSKKGIRIEWKISNNKPLKRSTIFNTRNRLIILRKADLGIDEEIIKNEAIKEYETYKKSMLTTIRNLREESKYKGQHIRSLIVEKHKQDKIIIGLTAEIVKVKSSIYRFEIMDFEE